MIRLATEDREPSCPQQLECIYSIAQVLVQMRTVPEVAQLVGEEIRRVLRADAICVFLENSSEWFEMIYDFGCSEVFRTQFRRLPAELVSEQLDEAQASRECLLSYSFEELKAKFPRLKDVIESSGRKAVYFAPLVVDGGVIGLLGYGYNQTPPTIDPRFASVLIRYLAQGLQRARLAEREKKLVEEAQASTEAREDFFANISHEIRTPLGVVLGFAESLEKDGRVHPDLTKWVTGIQRNAKHLLGIVGDILDFSKMKSDTFQIKNEKLSFKQICTEVVSEMRFPATAKGLHLHLIDESDVDFMYSDATRIRQILINLIGNAIKFTMTGSIRVIVENPGGSLRVRIVDTGMGIAQDCRQRIFEPFRQGDSSLQRTFGGTGLGLAISRRLARLLGGEVKLAESLLGQGSTFVIELPVRHPPLASQPVLQKSPSLLAQVPILLVDDSEDTRTLVSYMLTRAGASVTEAASGSEAVQLALAQEFSIVLMDLQMPVMSGYDALRALKRHRYTRPVVALTAHTHASEVARARQEGFVDYITKPITAEGLISRLLSLLERNRLLA